MIIYRKSYEYHCCRSRITTGLTGSLGEHHKRSDFWKINRYRLQLLVIGLEGMKGTSKSIKIPKVNNFKSVLFCIMLTVSRVACCVECFSRKSHWALKRTLLLSRKDFRRWYINFSNNRLKTESSDIGR